MAISGVPQTTTLSGVQPVAAAGAAAPTMSGGSVLPVAPLGQNPAERTQAIAGQVLLTAPLPEATAGAAAPAVAGGGYRPAAVPVGQLPVARTQAIAGQALSMRPLSSIPRSDQEASKLQKLFTEAYRAGNLEKLLPLLSPEHYLFMPQEWVETHATQIPWDSISDASIRTLDFQMCDQVKFDHLFGGSKAVRVLLLSNEGLENLIRFFAPEHYQALDLNQVSEFYFREISEEQMKNLDRAGKLEPLFPRFSAGDWRDICLEDSWESAVVAISDDPFFNDTLENGSLWPRVLRWRKGSLDLLRRGLALNPIPEALITFLHKCLNAPVGVPKELFQPFPDCTRFLPQLAEVVFWIMGDDQFLTVNTSALHHCFKHAFPFEAYDGQEDESTENKASHRARLLKERSPEKFQQLLSYLSEGSRQLMLQATDKTPPSGKRRNKE